MAKTIQQRDTLPQLAMIYAGIGAVLGFGYFLLLLALSRYVVDPLVCGVSGSAAQCSEAIAISGGIAAVIIAVAGVFLGIRYGLGRPLLVAISSAALLWGLAGWINGLFWLEAVGWSVLLYALSYSLFAWINRYHSLLVVVIVTLIIVTAARIVLVG